MPFPDRMLVFLAVLELELWLRIDCADTQGLSSEFYLSRRVSGVFHYDQRIRYSLTFPSAKLACKRDFGATLATRDQLHVAYLAGLEECRAGWISEREVAYPRIHRNWNCGQNRVGIISYGIRKNLLENWDVYCYKREDDHSVFNESMVLEGNTPRDRTENLSLYSVLPTSWKSGSKEPMVPERNLPRTHEYNEKVIQFPNIVTAHNTKHLSGSEILTQLNTMNFTLSSIFSPVNNSAMKSIEKSVKGFTTEYPDTWKHSLVSKESGKISSMEETQLTSNRANSGMTNSEDYSAAKNTTDANITSPEINEELLQIRNVTGDTTAKSLWAVTADRVSEHEVLKLSMVSLDVRADPDGGTSPQRNDEVTAAKPQLLTQTPTNKARPTQPANISNVEKKQRSPDLSNSLQSTTQSDRTDRFLFTDSKAMLLTEVKEESFDGFMAIAFTEEISEHFLSGDPSPPGFTVAPFSAVIHGSTRFVAKTVITGSTVQPEPDVTGKQMFLSQTSAITVSKEDGDESSKPVTTTVETAENVSSSVIVFAEKATPSEQDIYHQRDPHYLSGLTPQEYSLNRSAQLSSIDSNNTRYQNEETQKETNNPVSGLLLENNSTEMMENDPSDLSVQIEDHNTKRKFNVIDRDESKLLTTVWTPSEDLLTLSPSVDTNVQSVMLTTNNAALPETPPTRNHLQPEALRVEDMVHLSEKMQGYHGTVQLSTTGRDDTILSGTESDYRTVAIQVHTLATPTPESKIQLGISSHNAIAFPETITSGRNEELVTVNVKYISQEAISNVDQLGTKSHMTLDDEKEPYESGAIDDIRQSELIPEDTRLDVRVSTEMGGQVVTAIEMNTEQPVTHSIDHTSGAAVIADSSVMSDITSDLNISLQHTNSENHISESTVSDAELTTPSVDVIKLQNTVSTERAKQGTLKKDHNNQLFVQPIAEVLQSITSQGENQSSTSAITNKNDLSANNTVPTDDKVPSLIYKGNSTLQEVTTVPGMSGKPFSHSAHSSLEQSSFLGGRTDFSGTSTRSHTHLPAPVTGTEGSPLSKVESSQHSIPPLINVQISSSSASTGFVNITETSSSASLGSMQTLATERSLQLHLPATLSSPVATTGISTEKTSASPPAFSFVTFDSCGDVPKGTAGTFQSPGYPQSYPSDMDCIWVIEALPEDLVQLEFTVMSIERHRTCKYDYVIVYDGKGPNKVEMGRFCGSEVPATLQTSSNTMTIVMQSDSSVELEGFSAQFNTFRIPSGQTRLVGGRSMYSGLVEVEFDGKWGGICAKQWGSSDAKVVCHQLGFTGPALATRIKVSERGTPLAVSYAKCKGDEKILQNCDIRRTGKCTSNKRAAVICQVGESCAALKSAGVLESGLFIVDPDGTEGGVDAFPVECDMVSDPTTGISIIGHDSEKRMRVTPCEEAGCYSHTINYNQTSLDQLKVLIEASESCEQYVSVECRHIRFLKQRWGWWVSRDGRQINSWGGAPTDSGKCSCGENGNCALALSTCNCDANDGVWRQDEGFLRDKSTLPVREVRFGDTQDVPAEMAFHRIGALHCSGHGPKVPVLESCAALKEAGFQESKEYYIDPDGTRQGVLEFAVFCDMTSDPFTAITVVSHNSETRLRVAPCEEPGCYSRELSYQADLIQLNALTRVSESCEQHVKLDCRHIRFIQSGWGWWVSWDGRKMSYWGDANPDSGSCACGMSGSCSDPGKLCNCDSNDHIWRTDEGHLRDKSTLPVRSVHFGDTKGAPLEMAFHTIGKLMCKGIALQRKHLNLAK
eukprot:gi/632974159/ref/XP_007903517.1/ PREDICTED: uncharacterized threonine-rich GPI-anchored glycoprotein PJ4664.02-like [Callorhinchus milii]